MHRLKISKCILRQDLQSRQSRNKSLLLMSNAEKYREAEKKIKEKIPKPIPPYTGREERQREH